MKKNKPVFKTTKFKIPGGIEYLRNDTYRTSCSCQSPHHATTLWLCKDEDYPHVTLDMETYKYISKDSYTSWFSVFRKRIKLACRILFLGWFSTYGDMIFRDFQHLYDFAELCNYLGDELKEMEVKDNEF